jgi:hypothetical protein
MNTLMTIDEVMKKYRYSQRFFEEVGCLGRDRHGRRICVFMSTRINNDDEYVDNELRYYLLDDNDLVNPQLGQRLEDENLQKIFEGGYYEEYLARINSVSSTHSTNRI